MKHIRQRALTAALLPQSLYTRTPRQGKSGCMFGWIIVFFSGTAFYFLRTHPRPAAHTRLGFCSVFIAGYLGGLEMWLAIIFKVVHDMVQLLPI